MSTKPFTCKYCDHKFTKEKTLSVHVCEQKRRALARTEKHVVIGFTTYLEFYKKTQHKTEDKTYEDFCKSPYYNAFVKFGSFVSNVNPMYPTKFIEYVVTSGVKLDHWCRDELYEKYILHLIKTETVETAVQRSLNHMFEWADSNQCPWNQYFLYVSLNRAMYDIKDGKISPWLVLNCPNGKEMLKKFNDEQLAGISTMIDLPYWLKKFKTLPADVSLVKQIIKESNL
jgi:hypothetical protein